MKIIQIFNLINLLDYILLITVFLDLFQVICQSNNHAIEKRHVSVLARLGELPFSPGKRYVAALAKNGELTSYLRPTWNKKYLDTLEDFDDDEDYDKRYIGSLARSGELGVRSSEEKRSGVEGLVRGLATGEELKRLRLEALKEELYRERKEEQQAYIDSDENRSSSFGYVSEEDASSTDEEDESPEKRGGISSLVRNGYGFPDRTVDQEIERLVSDVYPIDDKRNVASLARGSLFPVAFSYPRRFEEEKRNIPSLLRDRSTPLGEGKRHIGSFVKNYGLPFADKRNIVSLAKNKDFPYMYMPGKRDSSSDEFDETELSKRYVAALLRHGRLPVGDETSHQDDNKDISLTQDDSKEDTNDRKKKSVDEVVSKENSRTKREAFDDMFGAFGPVRDKQSDDWTSPINKKYFGKSFKV